jgi:CubicO group peptidase (beta-lactamase class C family)
MRPMRALAILSVPLLIGACAAGGLAMPATEPDAALDALMQDYAGDVPGAAVLVVHDGDTLLRRGYGVADLDTGAAVTPRSNFRLASVSKQFTAAAILLLAQDGLRAEGTRSERTLSLDDPVRRWLPSLPAATDRITLRHLLTHSSGLVDYEDLMPPGGTEQGHADQIRDAGVLRLLEREDRLYFAPGSDYRYSNSGYALLALVVERASGQRYPDFLRERIFVPLGMDGAIAFEDGVSTVPDRAYGHSFVDARWVRTDQSSTSAVLGDGGIYASIDALAKWDAALRDDRLLSDASREAAFAVHTPIDDETDVDGYGYGWRVHDGPDGRLLWHSGETIGFRNVILRWPARRLTVVVLSNRNHPEPYPLALRIAALYR